MTKNKFLTILALTAALPAISEETPVLPTGMPQMQYSYCNNPLDNSNLGVSLNTTYYSCILLPANKGKSFGGNYITEVSIGIGDISDSEGEIWLSYDVNGEPFYRQPIELTGNVMAATYTLDQPHLIEAGKDLYIGWTCHADEYTNPIKGESQRSGSKADPRGDIVGFLDEDGFINWKHLADTSFGNLLMAVTIQGEKLPNYDIALENVSIDSYVSAGTPMKVSGNVRNYGKQTIDSYVVTYRVGSNPPVSITPQCWEMQTGAMFSFSFDIAKSVVGPNPITISVGNPGGHSDVNPDDNSWSGSFICYSTSHPDRKVLLEQFSTAYCSQCPDGHDRIEAGMADFDNVIWVTHHSGFYEDDMTTEDDRALTWFYGSPQTFAPAYMIDRTNMSDANSYLSTGPVMSVGQSNEIRESIVKASTQPSLAHIEALCDYDYANRLLKVDVSGGSLVDLSSLPTMVNVYLVEDSIIGFQSFPERPVLDYVHNHVFRKSLTGIFGEPVYWKGKAFEGHWEYTVPDDFKAENMRVVAFLSNYSAEDCNECMVLDAYETPLTATNDVGAVNVADWTAKVESGQVTIEGTCSLIQVVGIDGTCHCTISTPGTYELPTGMYLLHDGDRTEKIIIKQ